MQFQDLRNFRLPPKFRGKPGWFVQTWWLAEMIFLKLHLNLCTGGAGFAALLWRKTWPQSYDPSFGACTVSWKLEVGDYTWIGDEVVLYNLDEIKIGSHAVISQRSYLCTGSHQTGQKNFAINAKPIEVSNECWLATDVFVAPGITIGRGTVVGSRSSVFKSLPAGKICYGSPAKVMKDRIPESISELQVIYTSVFEPKPIELWSDLDSTLSGDR